MPAPGKLKQDNHKFKARLDPKTINWIPGQRGETLYVQQNKKDGMQSMFRQQLDSFSLIVIWFLKIGFFYVALAVHWAV